MSITTNPILRIVLAPLIWFTKLIGRNYPELLVRIRYFVRFRRFLNLKDPKTLNEKILYMSLRTDTNMWTKLADKYNVRKYVEDCGLSDILVPLFGHWEDAEEINFDNLPNQFVLKTTQGCGDIIIVDDKNNINKTDVIKKMNSAVKTKYGELEGGIHYMRIPPAIIAEGLLVNDEISKGISCSIIDYKIWCFNGIPYYIMTCSDRDDEGVDLDIYDIEWNSRSEYMVYNRSHRKTSPLPKPLNYERMIQIAQTLSTPFPVVRVDLYNFAGKIYFGEMTFTSLGGLMDYFTNDFQNLAGSKIDINYKP